MPGKGSGGQGQRSRTPQPSPDPPSPFPGNRAERLTKGLVFFTTARHPSPSRLRLLMPITSSCPSAPFSSPHRLLPARPLPPQLGFFLCSSPKASLLPFSLSSPPSLLSCRLSLGKGEGSLANTGRSQVEAAGRGKEEKLPNLH